MRRNFSLTTVFKKKYEEVGGGGDWKIPRKRIKILKRKGSKKF